MVASANARLLFGVFKYARRHIFNRLFNGCVKKKKDFGACSSNEVDLTLNNFKMESHRSLQRIIVVCSSTHKHFLSSLMVVPAQRKSTLHLRPQRTTTASCNRVWKS